MAAKPDPISACVLGIDAAWTAHQPSGIALVQNTAKGWSCLAIAPSYEAFIAQASGQPWDPEQKATGSRPDPAALLQASKQLSGAEVSCVSVDMPRRHCRSTTRRLRRPWRHPSNQQQGSHSPSPDRVLSPCGPAGLAQTRLPRALQGEPLRQILESGKADAQRAD